MQPANQSCGQEGVGVVVAIPGFGTDMVIAQHAPILGGIGLADIEVASYQHRLVVPCAR
jgi:hypothetical protein